MAKPASPNVVFVLADNLGWGDLGCYCGTVPTPRIDGLAKQGIRLRNCNLEAECTPSRSAVLTGRMPVRSGTFQVPREHGAPGGLCPWEYTVANLFSDAGYATAMYGKWHLGEVEGRLPTDQGFDEWWGIKNSSDEASYSAHPLFPEAGVPTPKIWQGVKGAPSEPTEDFDLTTRPLADERIARRTVDFIERQVAGTTPFFVYVALTQLHPPVLAHPDFVGVSRGGVISDILTEMDYRVGEILDALDEVGVADNTIVVFTSDNAAAHLQSAAGSNGPWRGSFFTPPFEGSHRAPAIIRVPGMLAAGTDTDEIFAAVDWLPTLASLAGESARVPTDRPIDGVDSSELLLGRSPHSGRDSFVFFGPDGKVMSVKWKTMKVILRYQDGMSNGIVEPRFPMIYDLMNDPGETTNVFEHHIDAGWVLTPVLERLGALEHSFARYRNIEPGEEFRGYQAFRVEREVAG